MLSGALAKSDLDADLVSGLRARRPGSYELLLRRYQRPVYSYVYRLIDDQADAEDVTQEVFVKGITNVSAEFADFVLQAFRAQHVAVRNAPI